MFFKYAASAPVQFLNSPNSYEMSGLLSSIAFDDNEESSRDEISLIRSKGESLPNAILNSSF